MAVSVPSAVEVIWLSWVVLRAASWPGAIPWICPAVRPLICRDVRAESWVEVSAPRAVVLSPAIWVRVRLATVLGSTEVIWASLIAPSSAAVMPANWVVENPAI